VALAVSLICPVAGLTQSKANVSIDLGKTVNVLTDTSLGLPMPTYDANSFNPASIPYLRSAGITSARFPANHGVSDLFHWSSKSTAPYKGAELPYMAPEGNFATFAQIAEKLGQGLVVVDYGSNQKGTGGADPGEAAAEVAYTNGDPASTQPLAKGASGEDWKTVGFWATLRGQDPLSDDDGLNFLRLHHPKAFGFKLWQIGDQVYNNGFYGSEHAGNPDLHATIPTGPKDFGKLKGDPKLSPAAYGDNLKLFALAMKAVDPTIQIGAALTTPPDGEKTAPDWNKNLLKSACASLDFVTLEWGAQPLLGPDYKTLDEPAVLSSVVSSFSAILTPTLESYGKYCPKGHIPKLAFSSAAIANWMKIENPQVLALWISDAYPTLIESGSVNVSWMEMYGNSMLSADRKKFGPAFYGIQMLHILARNPGDNFVEAMSNSGMVAVHATKRRDGFVGVMLINKDLKSPATVKVTVKGGTIGQTGKRFDYGTTQFAAGSPVAASAFTATGSEFTVTVPPYTISDILLPDHD
jgi:hypothetical protein